MRTFRQTRGASPFQSTLSMRRATDGRIYVITQNPISIHALHEESDAVLAHPRMEPATFQSTLSMRRATRTGHTSGVD